ncbi:MAG TPA: CsbD family protein [Stellaceae bacterium]|nr:CsbD family protein [Stellaceae bacterium]
MDKDRVAGSAKKVGGNIKEATGRALGDKKMESEGRVKKTEGKVQNAVGGAKDKIRESMKE